MDEQQITGLIDGLLANVESGAALAARGVLLDELEDISWGAPAKLHESPTENAVVFGRFGRVGMVVRIEPDRVGLMDWGRLRGVTVSKEWKLTPDGVREGTTAVQHDRLPRALAPIRFRPDIGRIAVLNLLDLSD
jgi:hypothetical protein